MPSLRCQYLRTPKAFEVFADVILGGRLSAANSMFLVHDPIRKKRIHLVSRGRRLKNSHTAREWRKAGALLVVEERRGS